MDKAPLKLLIYQLIFLIPAFYFVWYATGAFTASALAEILRHLFHYLWADYVYALKASGTDIIIYMQNLPLVAQGESAAVISLSKKGIVVNPFTYSYGIPLFLALAIASPATLPQYAIRISTGLVILYAGVCFSIIASIIFIMHETPGIQWPTLADSVEINDTLIDYIHFVGFLLIPRVLPLLMWVILYRVAIAEIIHSLRSNRVAEDTSGQPPAH